MMDNPVYLPNGYDGSPIPGWYFIDEASTYDGPYRTKEMAEQALRWYIEYLNKPRKNYAIT